MHLMLSEVDVVPAWVQVIVSHVLVCKNTSVLFTISESSDMLQFSFL